MLHMFVSWQHQASNTHNECFKWEVSSQHTHTPHALGISSHPSPPFLLSSANTAILSRDRRARAGGLRGRGRPVAARLRPACGAPSRRADGGGHRRQRGRRDGRRLGADGAHLRAVDADGERASDAPKRSEACGLCCLTLLSLHAHATLKLATKRAPGPTKAYMGLGRFDIRREVCVCGAVVAQDSWQLLRRDKVRRRRPSSKD